MQEHYTFHSVQTHYKQVNGHMEEVTEAVSVKNGKGTKSVRRRVNNTVRVAKRPLSKQELTNIKNRKFMPNLFTPCHGDCQKPRKTKKIVKKSKHQKQQ
jgi:hypothetical protein